MWSDNEAVVDLLNVQHLVGAVLRVIKDDRLDPVTVGVYGDWGSGKSSVIQLLRQQIETDPDLLCVYFNGWRFEGYEDAKAALASTILEQIHEEAERTGGKLETVKGNVVDAVKGFWGKVDKLRLGKQALAVGANVGMAAGAVALGATVAAPLTAAALMAAVMKSMAEDGKKIDGEALAKLMKDQHDAETVEQHDLHVSIRDFHKEFAALVNTLGVKRLVVVVDDLDRCLPHNVIETLEAIRLFLSAPKTAFVIAADEALIREAVGYRFPEQAVAGVQDSRPKASVGARYLEKLIQVPIRVPPLSPSDLHGYLNLLFADQREADEASFADLCQRVRASSSYDAVSFHMGNAKQLLGRDVSDDLKSDFLLAEQIAPVLALSAEGNPRQTKRFLNALVLRLEMGGSRRVTLDRTVAAKMLLLEYFLPELFRTLALEMVGQGGKSETLAALERHIREEPEVDGESKASGTVSTFAGQANAMIKNDRFRTWLRVDPPLGGVDLRPYIYFAQERFALPVGVTQRLSPAGNAALSRLLGESEAEQATAAITVASLPMPEVTTILSELTAKARTSGIALDVRTSPMHAMIEIAKRRPDVGADVIAAILGIPYETLPPGAAVAISSLSATGNLHDAVVQALNTLAGQTRNSALKQAAKLRLQSVQTPNAQARQ